MKSLSVKRTLSLEQVEQQHEGCGKQQAHYQRYADNEQPVLPGVLLERLLVTDQKVVVAAIGLPRDVGQIADDRDRSERVFNRQIHHHAKHGDACGSAPPCRDHDEERGKRGQSVADAGNQADQGIQPEANARPGNDEAIIEPCRNEIELLVRRWFRDGGRCRLQRWKDFASNTMSALPSENVRRPRTPTGCSLTLFAAIRLSLSRIYRVFNGSKAIRASAASVRIVVICAKSSAVNE